MYDKSDRDFTLDFGSIGKPTTLARKLPRTHQSVTARARFSATRKIKPEIELLDLCSDELMEGGLSLDLTVSKSSKHAETFSEYLDYLHFLTVKQQDHYAKSVLELDNDLGKEARQKSR